MSFVRHLPLLSMPLMLAAAGCTRTYDGSIVPMYTTVVSSDRGLRVNPTAIPTDTLPPNRLVRFPPPPASMETAESSTPSPQRPRRARSKAVARLATDPLPPRRYSCRDVTSESGRVRVVCE
jgi:hypothetical protein